MIDFFKEVLNLWPRWSNPGATSGNTLRAFDP